MGIFFVLFVLPVLLLLSGDSDFILIVFEFNSCVVHFIGVLVMFIFDDVIPP